MFPRTAWGTQPRSIASKLGGGSVSLLIVRMSAGDRTCAPRWRAPFRNGTAGRRAPVKSGSHATLFCLGPIAQVVRARA